MPIIPKIAGATSLISSLDDINKTALIYSKQEKNKAVGNNILSCSIANQKADYVSFKDAQRKNWFAQRCLFININEIAGAVKGYFKGAVYAIDRYLPKIALSLMAIIPKEKGKKLSYISTVALAGVELWDFLKNGTGMLEKSDYLNRK